MNVNTYAEVQSGIEFIKDEFQNLLKEKLHLTRVSAPLFLPRESGLNDDLNGVEEKVSFTINASATVLEIVQSLAKWKRYALAKYGMTGIYTDMNAIRKSESIDDKHSIYVDQWDWEKTLSKEQRNVNYLHSIVDDIYSCLVELDKKIAAKYSVPRLLPDAIYKITSQELLDSFPGKTPQEREHAIAEQHKAVFVQNIGHKLTDGKEHDLRAPDYDDWNLNGDIIVWNPVLNDSLELSSMGIRVDKATLVSQLKLADKEQRVKLPFHQMIMNDAVPLSVGGGIGQSRLCMFFLQRRHICEVQASYWTEPLGTSL